MKISYKWLHEYVETDRSPQEVAELLTMAGIEAGDVVPLVKGLKGVVVGEIEVIERELGKTTTGQSVMLCRISTHKEHFQVVSGAPNLRVGARAAFAPPGALLAGDRRIEATKIRGTVSHGMLCLEAD